MNLNKKEIDYLVDKVEYGIKDVIKRKQFIQGYKRTFGVDLKKFRGQSKSDLERRLKFYKPLLVKLKN